MEELPELLGVYSGMLNKLEVDLTGLCCKFPSALLYCFCKYIFWTGEINVINHLPESPPILPNLQQLTIRTAVDLDDNEDHTPARWVTTLPAAAEAINSIPRHLILVCIDPAHRPICSYRYFSV